MEIISEHTGFTTQEVHEFLKNKFLPKKHKTLEDKNGIPIEVCIPTTTTELSTGEFKRYLEDIQIWSAETLGIQIPDPNENVPNV